MARRPQFTARVIAAVPLLFLPAAVVAATPLAALTTLAFVALIPTLLALLQGRRVALATAGATAGLVVLVELATPHPVLAVALMVVVGLVIGATGLRGRHGIAVVVCTWPSVLLVSGRIEVVVDGAALPSAAAVALAGGVTIAAGLWTVLVGRVLLSDLRVTTPEPLRPVVSTIYGGGLAVLLGATTLGAIVWDRNSMAGWALLTILVIARPDFTETWHRVVTRSLGTIAGGLLAATVSLLIGFGPVVVGVGIVALVAAVVLQLTKANYAVYALALTAAIVLLTSTGSGSSAIGIDVERVLFTVIGAVLTAIAAAILQFAVRRALRASQA